MIFDRLWAIRQDAMRKGRKITALYLGRDEMSQAMAAPRTESNPLQRRFTTDYQTVYTIFGIDTFEVAAKSHVGANTEED